MISILVFFLGNTFLSIIQTPNATFKAQFSTSQVQHVENNKQNQVNAKEIEQAKTEESKQERLETITSTKEEKWLIQIPVINLEAPIQEGTRKETMNQYVGHFEETPTTFGNVGLAAHNRGYPKNYFQNIKKLKKGDKIIYQYKDFTRTYSVEKQEIIEDTNWEFLKNTKEENKLTLITCVENEPNYRRCIQAIEEK